VATALYAWSGHWWPILVFMAFLAVLTLVALALGPETVRRDLEDPARQANPGAPREPSPTVASDASSRS
jgi:hypothetical protein